MAHKYSLGFVKKEYPFVFPTGDSVPDSDKVTLWFRRAPRDKERKILSEISTFITDEKTKLTKQHFDSSRMDTLYAECLTKIDNLDLYEEGQSPDGFGDKADVLGDGSDGKKLSRIQNFLRGNLGFDIDDHGSLEVDLAVWFQRVILRNKEQDEDRKNSKTPPSDSSAEEK